MGSLGPLEVFIILVVCFIPAILFWRICSKTGFPGALGLLVLIPGLGILILLLVLAFSAWPIERELREAGQRRHD